MIRQTADMSRRLALVCATLVLAASGLAGCGTGERPAAATSEAPAVAESSPPGDAYFPEGGDFRDWAQKKGTTEEAEKALQAKVREATGRPEQALQVKVRAPADSRGRELAGVYVTETYPNGTPVELWDRTAILDYSGYFVRFMPCRSAERAREWVELNNDPVLEAAGLTWRDEVNGSRAVVTRKAQTETIIVAGSSVDWSVGTVYISVTSEVMPPEELLAIARSIDYR